MIIGTAGHVDHGKTSLVRALTGVDTDRLKEEKARGMSIDLGFAYLAAPQGTEAGGVLGFVDVPGHERFVHNMLAGAAGIDFALLVVAADDGVMPQTREHLAILDLLGIATGLVALTKIDLVPPARRREVAAEIAELLAGTSLARAELVEVSTASGEGLEALRDRLFAAAATVRREHPDGRFRLAVDRCFTLPGAGTIVTGTVLSGSVAVGDRVIISPGGRVARVRSLHAQNRAAETGRVGERCALNLAGEGIDRRAVARGDVVFDPDLHAPTERIDALLRLLPSATKPLRQGLPARLHHAAAEIGVRLLPLGRDGIAPDGTGWVQLALDRPIAAAAGDRFIVRDAAARHTLGGGRFVDLRPPQRRRHAPERLAQLRALAQPDPAQALAGLVGGPPFYVELTGFARDRALDPKEIAALADRLGLVRFGAAEAVYALSAPRWTGLSRDLVKQLGVCHAEHPDMRGIARDRLRTALQPVLPQPVFAAALQALTRRGDIAVDGAWVRLAAHRPRLTEAQEALYTRLRPLIGGKERFRPPRVRDIAGRLAVPENVVRQVLKLAARQGRVDEVAPDHFFLPGTIAEIVAIAQAIVAVKSGGQFTAADLRDRLDNGRKVAIQILEFLDRHGVTVRRGDLRSIDPQRAELFGAAAGNPPAAATRRRAVAETA
jgi:selenocysteine-specific elongation factor